MGSAPEKTGLQVILDMIWFASSSKQKQTATYKSHDIAEQLQVTVYKSPAGQSQIWF